MSDVIRTSIRSCQDSTRLLTGTRGAHRTFARTLITSWSHLGRAELCSGETGLSAFSLVATSGSGTSTQLLLDDLTADERSLVMGETAREFLRS